MDLAISIAEAIVIGLVVAVVVNYLIALWIGPWVKGPQLRTFFTLCLYTVAVGAVTVTSMLAGVSSASAFAFAMVTHIAVLSFGAQDSYVMLTGVAVSVAAFIVAQAAASGNILMTMFMVLCGIIASIILTMAWLIVRPKLTNE